MVYRQSQLRWAKLEKQLELAVSSSGPDWQRLNTDESAVCSLPAPGPQSACDYPLVQEDRNIV